MVKYKFTWRKNKQNEKAKSSKTRKASVVGRVSRLQSIPGSNVASTTGFPNGQLNRRVCVSKTIWFSSRDHVHILGFFFILLDQFYYLIFYF